MVLQHCFSIADPDANFKFSLIVATENSAGQTSVFLVLRVSTLFRIPTTVLLLMDLLYYAETDTDADRICIEFPSRNPTLCEEVEIAINPDNLAQQLLFFLTEGSGSQYIPEKLIREGVIVVTLS